jgi:hypothetical protein
MIDYQKLIASKEAEKKLLLLAYLESEKTVRDQAFFSVAIAGVEKIIKEYTIKLTQIS